MPPADQALSTLLDDLSERGLLDETLIVWTGEFGRTPRIGQRNSDAGAGADGRDHWPNCFTSVLAGGSIKGGHLTRLHRRCCEFGQRTSPEESAVAESPHFPERRDGMHSPALQACIHLRRP